MGFSLSTGLYVKVNNITDVIMQHDIISYDVLCAYQIKLKISTRNNSTKRRFYHRSYVNSF